MNIFKGYSDVLFADKMEILEQSRVSLCVFSSVKRWDTMLGFSPLILQCSRNKLFPKIKSLDRSHYGKKTKTNTNQGENKHILQELKINSN